MLYTQIHSDHEELTEDFYRETDLDGKAANRWAVSYDSGGTRTYTLADGSTQSSDWIPVWAQSNEELPQNDALKDANDVLIYAPDGYAAETGTITGQETVGTREVKVGEAEDKLADVRVVLERIRIEIDTEEGTEEPFVELYVSLAGTGAAKFTGGPWDNGSQNLSPSLYPTWPWERISKTGLSSTAILDYTWHLFEDDPSNDDHIGEGKGLFTIPGSTTTYTSKVSNADGWGEIDLKVYVKPTWVFKEDFFNTFNDYTYDWASAGHEIRVPRVQLSYQWTSLDHAIYDYRPVYETRDVETKVVKTKYITDWDLQPVTQSQTELYSQRSYIADERPAAAFGANSVVAAAVTITTGGDVSVSGLVKATSGALRVNAGDNLTVQGLGGGNNTLAPLAQLSAPETLSLTAGGVLTIAEPAIVATTNATTGALTLTAGKTLSLGGEVSAADTVTASAGGDVALVGKVTAADAITVTAGASSSKDGDVTGTIGADLRVTGAGNDLAITAGALNGSILLTDSSLSAAGRVELVAGAGKVEHSGTITAATLYGRAERGFSSFNTVATGTGAARAATVSADSLDIGLSATGDISLYNAKAVTLTDVEAADGTISIHALGTITATRVATLGTSDRNDILLTTTGTANDLSLVSVSAGGRGDVTLSTQGAVSMGTGSVAVAADELTITGGTGVTGVTVNTAVATIAVETTAAGNARVTQAGSGALVVSRARIADGSFTVTGGGSVELADVVLRTNADANDVTVTAAGDVKVRYVNAGFYAATFGEVPAAGAGAEAGITSHGDIFLTSTGGAIVESFTDTGVDIVADRLELRAATSISGLETALNTLALARADAGDIDISEQDGFGEKTEGLRVLSVVANKSAGYDASIQAENLLQVGERDDTVPSVAADVIRLTSTGGNVEVVQPASGQAIDYNSGVAFDAGESLILYTFFNAPKFIEYRAGDHFEFDLPANLTSGSVILETGSVISITGTITASETLELISGTNVFITGNIVAGDGAIDTMVVKALGKKLVQTAVDTEDAGRFSLSSQDSGYININTTGIAASNFELRALRDITVDLDSNFALTGFAGGLSGFDPAANVTIETTGTLTVKGGIVAANRTSGDLVLRAASILADKSSTFIGEDLIVEAEGDIRVNTVVENLWAESSVAGDIFINESDDINLMEVLAADGAIEASAGGALTAYLVRAIADKTGNDITLASSGDLVIDAVEAGFAAGAEKANAIVTLDAAGTISEMSPYDDSAVDVAAHSIIINGATAAPPQVVTGPHIAGSGADLEIFYTAADSGLTAGATTMSGSSGIPTTVTGDYVLVASDRGAGNLTMNVTGTLTVVDLPTYSGDNLSLAAAEDLVIVSPLNVGGATITLSAGDNVTLGDTVAAGRLNVTAGDDLTVTTQVGTLHVTMNQAGDLTVLQTGNLVIESVQIVNGDVDIVGSGNITIQRLTGNIGELAITSSSGSIAIASTADAGNVILSAAGGISGSLEADSLSITAAGSVSLVESNGVTISSLTQNQTNASVSIATTSGTLTVAGPVAVSGSGRIALQSAGTGSLVLSEALTAGSGGVILTSGGAMTMTAAADVTAGNGAVSLTSGGALTMTGETWIDAGAGSIAINAAGTLTLGKLATTGTADVVIFSGGAVIDASDSPTDVTAPNAELVIVAVGGIGSANALETQVASLNLSNSGSGNIRIDETDAVTVARVAQSASGAVSIATASGAITVAEAGISATSGTVTLYAGGSDHDGIAVNAAIATTGGAVTLTAEDGDVTFAGGIEVAGSGNISITASQGAIVNAEGVSGWLQSGGGYAGSNFSADIDWALRSGKFTVNAATGQVTVNAPGDARHGRVLRSAEGPYIQTTGGLLTLTALDGLGEAVTGFAFSPRALMVDAEQITLNSADRKAVHVLAAEQVEVAAGSGTAGAKGGAATVVTLSGKQQITSVVDASGEDLSIVGDDIDINDLVRSAGATLTVRPLTEDRKIIIGTSTGTTSGALYLDSSELARLQNGFAEIVVGSEEGSYLIEIGDSAEERRDAADNTVSFTDTLVLRNQASGGEVHIYGDVIGTNGASLKIYGSGATTTLSADVNVAGAYLAADSVKVDGARSVTAGTTIDFGTTAGHFLDGDGDAGDDTLTLTAGAGQSLIFTGIVGGTDPLEGLTITQGGNVTFNRAVTVDGNLAINASGAITFTGAVSIAGMLAITGATSVTFASTAAVAGDILIESNEIDFTGGADSVSTTGGAAIILKPATTGQRIQIADWTGQTDDDSKLTLISTDLAALADGFSSITIGRMDSGDGHAEATTAAGTVTIGAVENVELFTDPTKIFGGRIDVRDHSTTAITVKTGADLTLDAVGNITIYNAMEAGASGASNLTFYRCQPWRAKRGLVVPDRRRARA